MPPPLVLVNPDGSVAEVNDAAARLLGDVRGHACNEVVRGRDGEGVPVCSATCVASLARSGGAGRVRRGVRVRDRWWRLVCTSMGPMTAVQMFEDAGPEVPTAKLTPRERQVFELVAEGLTSPQIAERLKIGPATVRTHVEHIREKVGAHTRAEAVARLVQTRDGADGGK